MWNTAISWIIRSFTVCMIVMYIVAYIYLRVQSAAIKAVVSAQRLKAEKSLLYQVGRHLLFGIPKIEVTRRHPTSNS